MSNHRDSFPEEADEIKYRLEAVGFEVIEMLFDVPNLNRNFNWAYVNYLQVGNKIIVPTFGIPEDKQALKYIREANPDCIVRGFRMRNIAKSQCLQMRDGQIRYLRSNMAEGISARITVIGSIRHRTDTQ